MIQNIFLSCYLELNNSIRNFSTSKGNHSLFIFDSILNRLYSIIRLINSISFSLVSVNVYFVIISIAAFKIADEIEDLIHVK